MTMVSAASGADTSPDRSPPSVPGGCAAGASLAVCIAIGSGESPEPIAAALDSVSRQDTAALEVVVKVLGEHLADLVSSHWRRVSNARLTILTGEDDGIYDALNRCVRAASASHVLFLGCGDTLADISVATEIIRTAGGHPLAEALYGQVLLADEDGTPRSLFNNACFHGERLPLPWRNPCHSQGLVYRREWLSAHPFSTSVGPLADLVHTHGHCMRRKAVWMDRPLAVFRTGGASNQRSRRAFRTRLRGLYAACDIFPAPWLWRLATWAVAHVDHIAASQVRLPASDRARAAGVSVVMAVHNGRRFLPEQLSSLLADLQPCDEVIVIDDASSDGSGEWIESAADARVRVHRHAANCGVQRSFQHGLSLATRDVVFLCDQDDCWVAGKRSAFINAFARNPLCLVALSDAQVIDGESRLVASSFMKGRGGFRAGFWANVWRNRYLGCAMAVRRNLLSMALPIPAAAPMHDMWLGILGAMLGHVVYLPHPWIQYRRHGANLSPESRRAWWRVIAWRVGLLYALAIRRIGIALRSVWRRTA